MTGKLKDITFSRDNKQIISIELNGDFREQFDTLADTEVDIEIKKHHKKRSLDANAFSWVLINKLAEKLGKTKEEIYREQIRHIGGVSEIVCVREIAYPRLKEVWESKGTGWQVEQMPSKIEGCVNAILYYGSSTYDTAQMSSLINNLITDCEAVGIPTITPKEAESLLSHWGARKEKNNG